MYYFKMVELCSNSLSLWKASLWNSFDRFCMALRKSHFLKAKASCRFVVAGRWKHMNLGKTPKDWQFRKKFKSNSAFFFPSTSYNKPTGCFGLQETTFTKRHTKIIKGVWQAGLPKGQTIGTQLYHLKIIHWIATFCRNRSPTTYRKPPLSLSRLMTRNWKILLLLWLLLCYPF